MFNPAAFFTYIFLMSFTPGPNNVMSMSNASEKGFKKSFPFNLGILFGCLAVMVFCAFFSSMLYSFIPQIKPYMTIAGAGYMLWLAWSVLKPLKEKKAGKVSKQGFLAGVLLQFVNPKLYIYGITAMSSYILPYFSGYAVLLGFVFLLAFMGFMCTICWAMFGVGLSRLFRDHNRLMNGIMAALLCYCAISLFF